MKLITQEPNDGIGEDLEWQTNIIVATDGTEQRIMLCPYPRRVVKATLQFDDERDVRRMLTTMLAGTDDAMLMPFWQSAVRITATANSGTSGLVFNVSRTDIREGQNVVIAQIDGTLLQGVVDSIDGTGCTLAAPLAATVKVGARLVPVWPMYSASQMNMNRRNPDYAATMTLAMRDTGFMVPYLDATHVAVSLPTFGGLTLLAINSVGSEFNTGVDTGASWTDYGGQVEVRSQWNHAHFIFSRDFQCNRVFDPTSWQFWRTFFDYAKGSLNPFFIPTYREDFAVVTPAPQAGNHVTFEGVDYADDFYPYAPFKQLAIFSDGGLQCVTVTSVSKVGGNTICTFTPALPNNVAWTLNQKVSLLLKVRITDDKVALMHNNTSTNVALNLRTCDA